MVIIINFLFFCGSGVCFLARTNKALKTLEMRLDAVR